jgi:hypothetical protein
MNESPSVQEIEEHFSQHLSETGEPLSDWALAKRLAAGVGGGLALRALAGALRRVGPYYKGDPRTYWEATRYVDSSMQVCREALDEALEEFRARTRRRS